MFYRQQPDDGHDAPSTQSAETERRHISFRFNLNFSGGGFFFLARYKLT